VGGVPAGCFENFAIKVNMMKLSRIFSAKSALALALIAGVAMNAIAQHTPAETKKDIQRHRAMAAAHEAAAKCLESGKKEEVCQKELQAACKGLGIGKDCGMKHEH
jgi:uncharacterized protein YgiB involved in biofilm formation